MNQNLDIGDVLGRSLRYYRDQAGLLLPAAAIIFFPIALINGAIYASDASPLLLLATSVLSIVGAAWLAGMVVEAVRDIQDGVRDFELGGLFRSVMPVIVPLLVVGLLAGLGIGIGFILLIVPGLILLTIWAVVSPVVVVERPGIFPSFGRSRELVRGNGWQVFGVVVIVAIATAIARAILNGIAGAADNFAVYALADLVASILLAPVTALAAAVLYFELRRLKGEPPVSAGAEPATPAVPPAPPPGAPPPPSPQTAPPPPTQQDPPAGGSQPPPPG